MPQAGDNQATPAADKGVTGSQNTGGPTPAPGQQASAPQNVPSPGVANSGGFLAGSGNQAMQDRIRRQSASAKALHEQIDAANAEIRMLKEGRQTAQAPPMNPAPTVEHSTAVADALSKGDWQAASRALAIQSEAQVNHRAAEAIRGYQDAAEQDRVTEQFDADTARYDNMALNAFPDMSNGESELFKRTVAIWQSDQNLQSSASGKYDAAMRASHELNGQGMNRQPPAPLESGGSSLGRPGVAQTGTSKYDGDFEADLARAIDKPSMRTFGTIFNKGKLWHGVGGSLGD